jgi:hypothetical protein
MLGFDAGAGKMILNEARRYRRLPGGNDAQVR